MLRAPAIALLFGLGSCHGPKNHYGVSGPNQVQQEYEKPAAPAGVTGEDVDYDVGGVTYQGYKALPPPGMDVKGSLLVVHAFYGLSDVEKAYADQFAGMGYVAFAGDMYGKGVRCQRGNFTCGVLMTQMFTGNMERSKTIISGATDALLALPGADADRLVAMGYCFGGGVVLELARHPQVGGSSGVTYKAVSAIHTSTRPFGEAAENSSILTDIQVHHAETDGDEGLLALEEELRLGVEGTNASWESLKYSNVPHGWTFPSSYPRQAIQVHHTTEVFFRLALGIVDSTEYSFPLLCSAASPADAPFNLWMLATLVAVVISLVLLFMLVSRDSNPQGQGEINLAENRA